MRKAYLLILLGIIFNHFNFYIPSLRINCLPNFIGYLLTLIAILKLDEMNRGISYGFTKVILSIFLVNELIKYFYYPYLYKNIFLLLFITVFFMVAQLLLYRGILHAYYLFSKDVVGLWYQRIYLIIASLSILVYLYMCFFGGSLFLMNLFTIAETVCLLLSFLHIHRFSLSGSINR